MVRSTACLDPVSQRTKHRHLAASGDVVLVTGAGGFIGSRVVEMLFSYGFKHVRCFLRKTSNSKAIESIRSRFGASSIEIVTGNLISREDCSTATKDVSLIYHLAAGTDKTFPGCFLNSVVTTRNLLEASLSETTLKRLVNVSSIAVYSNQKIPRGGLLDESCELEANFVARHDPYAYAKAKQDELVVEYGRRRRLPYVIVRPGVTFGPGKARIPGRVGTDTFGIFMHLGMNNKLPLTYVENCAEAIVLAGLKPGIEGEVINIVDDDLPTSRAMLRMYKTRARPLASIPVPYPAFYLFSWLWEKYSSRSEGQLPPVFNRLACATYYKGNKYSNRKAKELLGWQPRVGMSDALERFLTAARDGVRPQ